MWTKLFHTIVSKAVWLIPLTGLLADLWCNWFHAAPLTNWRPMIRCSVVASQWLSLNPLPIENPPVVGMHFADLRPPKRINLSSRRAKEHVRISKSRDLILIFDILSIIFRIILNHCDTSEISKDLCLSHLNVLRCRLCRRIILCAQFREQEPDTDELWTNHRDHNFYYHKFSLGIPLSVYGMVQHT